MNKEGKYIYSIIQENENRSFGPIGINNQEVNLVPYQDVAAVVSNTPVINFNRLDKTELTKYVAIHQKVNEEIMKDYDVVPMAFGIIAPSPDEVLRILAKAYIQFKAALERIAGKAEFIVQVFWNEKNILEKLLRENIEIQKLKKSAESKGRILGFSSKMELGKRIFEAIEACRKEYTKDILGDIAANFPNFSASKLLDKEMLMNYSFLIGATEESALEFKLNQLAEKYKDELKFKYIGPMASYSFAVINFSLGNFDLVDNARKTLGLGESAAFLEIRDAYHKLAREHHPDKQSFTKDQVILEEAEKNMKDIITANEVLTVYCKHYFSALAPEKEQLCSFKKEDVEDSIIIKEKQIA